MTEPAEVEAPAPRPDLSVEEVANLLVAFRSAPANSKPTESGDPNEWDAPRVSSPEEAAGGDDEAEISQPSGTSARKPRGQRPPKPKPSSKNRIDLSAVTIEEARPRAPAGPCREASNRPD